MLATLVGAGLYWWSGADERWIRDVAIPRIEHYIEPDDWGMAYRMAMPIEKRVPGSTLLDVYWGEFSVIIGETLAWLDEHSGDSS